MSKVKGYVLYEGPSAINGEDIAAILTLNSSNVKTGNMAQLWIMHQHVAPHIAQKTGEDTAVCGDCPIKKECYVLTFQGPLSVWNAYKRGSYVKLNPALTVSNMLDETQKMADFMLLLKNLTIRFGAYGDPAALPKYLVKSIAENCKDFTGYTHQWNKPQFNYLKNYFLASVETEKFAEAAQVLGFKTFRIKSAAMPLNNNEIVCPADSHGIQCIDCRLCNGGKQSKNIVINAHGARAGGIAYA